MGARLSAPQGDATPPMPPQQVISWVLVGCLPVTLPLALWVWPTAPASAAAWGGFVYVSVFSMWLGFFAWYRGLQLGGMLRVSQIQLLQPFLAMLLAVPVLGEPLQPLTVAFAAVVMVAVAATRRMANPAASTPAPR
jgi:drug/metabolite transporter (DMT)-like permease